MKMISRRKFIVKALASLAAMTSAYAFISVPTIKKDIALNVDKDGNATLRGAEIVVDKNDNAKLM